MPPLDQLSLKLPPAVLSSWRDQAAAAGFGSVRDWLVAITAAPADRAAAPTVGELADRLAAIEAQLAVLASGPQAQRSPAPSKPASPKQGTAPSPEKAKPPSIPGDAITTAELAEERLGLNRRTFNERLRRGGGARAGLVVEGWRCVGQSAPPAGGPLRWMWEPVGT